VTSRFTSCRHFPSCSFSVIIALVSIEPPLSEFLDRIRKKWRIKALHLHRSSPSQAATGRISLNVRGEDQLLGMSVQKPQDSHIEGISYFIAAYDSPLPPKHNDRLLVSDVTDSNHRGLLPNRNRRTAVSTCVGQARYVDKCSCSPTTPFFQTQSPGHDQDHRLTIESLLFANCAGGRTAWSCTVKVFTKELSARFWYDGKNSNNAKEDAAEVGINWLNSSSPTLPPALRNRGW